MAQKKKMLGVRRGEVVRFGRGFGLYYGELKELQGLVHSAFLNVGTSGYRISIRQEQLTQEATDDQFIAVLSAAGLGEGDAEELYPELSWDEWPDQEEALEYIESFGKKFPPKRLWKNL